MAKFSVGQRVCYTDGWDEKTDVECTVKAVDGTSYEVETDNGAVTVIEEKHLRPAEQGERAT